MSLSMLLCCCDKVLSKITVSEEGVCLAYRLQSIIQGNQTGTQAGDLEAGTEAEIWEALWFLFCFPSLLSYLSYGAQVHLPWDDSVNSGVGPPMSISNQDASQMCLQGKLMKRILPLRFPLHRHI